MGGWGWGWRKPPTEEKSYINLEFDTHVELFVKYFFRTAASPTVYKKNRKFDLTLSSNVVISSLFFEINEWMHHSCFAIIKLNKYILLGHLGTRSIVTVVLAPFFSSLASPSDSDKPSR
ncbi:Hypothetical predicted protein [Podarcis lilfordi]|uniref:Uncharacterized protein n=1 Tax=Podarcis lilfordi TaxID=74358 RepID=A0AA35L3Z9_9SAUR|nr:Hypothetical predicted protein [Podarcis lilfordi]